MTHSHGSTISAHHGNQVPEPITAATAQMATSAAETVAQAPMATVPGPNRSGLAGRLVGREQ